MTETEHEGQLGRLCEMLQEHDIDAVLVSNPTKSSTSSTSGKGKMRRSSSNSSGPTAESSPLLRRCRPNQQWIQR